MTADRLTSQAARGGAVTLVAQALKLALMITSIVVLARLIGPGDYGVFAMAVAVIGVAEILRDFGLSMAALQAKHLAQAQQSNLFWLNSAIGLALGLVVFAASWPIAAFFDQPVLVPVVQLLSATYALNGASTQFKVVINRRLQFVALSLVDIVPYIVGFGGALYLAVTGAGLWALVAQQLLVAAATLLLAVVFSRWMPSAPRRVAMDGLVSFGWRIAVTQFVSYLTRHVDSIAIGRVWGSEALGLYDRASQIVVMPLNQLNAPLSRVAIPTIARVRDEPERFERALRKAQLIALYLTASVFGMLVAIGDKVVVVVLGSDWDAAGIVIQLLAIGGVFRALTQICYWIYVSKGLASEQMRYFLVAQPVLAIAVLTGLPWGPAGVAASSSIGFAIYWACSLAWACRKAGISSIPLFADALRAIIIFVVPAVLIALSISRATDGSPALVSIFASCFGALMYWALLIAVSRRVRADMTTLIALLRTVLRRAKKAE